MPLVSWYLFAEKILSLLLRINLDKVFGYLQQIKNRFFYNLSFALQTQQFVICLSFSATYVTETSSIAFFITWFPIYLYSGYKI